MLFLCKSCNKLVARDAHPGECPTCHGPLDSFTEKTETIAPLSSIDIGEDILARDDVDLSLANAEIQYFSALCDVGPEMVLASLLYTLELARVLVHGQGRMALYKAIESIENAMD